MYNSGFARFVKVCENGFGFQDCQALESLWISWNRAYEKNVKVIEFWKMLNVDWKFVIFLVFLVNVTEVKTYPVSVIGFKLKKTRAMSQILVFSGC